jgi:hypothetical protein
MDEHPNRASCTLEAESQRENQRIAEIHRELEEMLRHAKERSAASLKRAMASTGVFHNPRMFIRH